MLFEISPEPWMGSEWTSSRFGQDALTERMGSEWTFTHGSGNDALGSGMGLSVRGTSSHQAVPRGEFTDRRIHLDKRCRC